MDTMMRGAISGLVGTAAMTAAMAAARAAGASGGPVPPREVAGNLEERLGLRDELPGPVFEASWLVQHIAYGAAAGIAYALIERRLGLDDPWVAGPAYGLALWAFGYGGWAPAAGLYPRPGERPARRIATEITTHLIYGAATAWAAWRLRPQFPAMARQESRPHGHHRLPRLA